MNTLAHVPQGEIRLHVGLLSLFIGLGLLRHRRIWRIIAMATLGLVMGILPILVVAMLFATQKPVQYTLFGRYTGEIPMAFTVAALVAIFLMAVWQYSVLKRPGVRRLFHIHTN